MRIIDAVHTNINIFTDVGQRVKIDTPAKPEQPALGEPLPSNMDAALSELSRMVRENSNKGMTQEHEMFYAADKTLEYTPGGHSVEIEIALATQRGYAAIVDGRLTPSFSVGLTNGNVQSSAMAANSPLDFEQKINNLKSLFEHLGDNAINYTSEFDAALQGIIGEFIDRGGMYVQADKNGIADSIRAMFSGEEGKYTADDLKTMAALSFHSQTKSYPQSASEHTLGAMLGFDALMIEMAHTAGKLSGAAHATVKAAFNSHVDDLMKQMDEYLNWQKNDAWSPKNVTYSPPRTEVVREAIDLMLRTLDGGDFNQSLRIVLRMLEDKHDAQRESQLSNGALDQRYNMLFFNTVSEKASFGDAAQISSRYFSEFLNQPQWAVSGNLFPVDVAV